MVTSSDPSELPSLSLRQMALGPADSREEITALRHPLDDLDDLIELDAFHQRRAAIFGRMDRLAPGGGHPQVR